MNIVGRLSGCIGCYGVSDICLVRGTSVHTAQEVTAYAGGC